MLCRLHVPSASPFGRENNSPVVTWQKLCMSINRMYSSSLNRMPWTVIISSVFLCFANIFFSWFMTLPLTVWSPNIWKRSHVLLPLTHKCQSLCFWGCEWLLMFSYAGFLNKIHTGYNRNTNNMSVFPSLWLQKSALSQLLAVPKYPISLFGKG